MNRLTGKDVDIIVELLDASGDPVVAHKDYVGYATYGRSCLGFIVDQPHRFMLRLGRLLGADVLDEEVVEALESFDVRVDDFGLQRIVYFPDVEVRDE